MDNLWSCHVVCAGDYPGDYPTGLRMIQTGLPKGVQPLRHAKNTMLLHCFTEDSRLHHQVNLSKKKLMI